MKKNILMLVIALLMTACQSVKVDSYMIPQLETIKTANPEFDPQLEYASDALDKYYDYYQLNYPNIQNKFGYIDAGKYRIAMQCFEGKDLSKGTVLLIHGYFDHSGIWYKLIPELTSKGYRVISVDLPGHGLSSGRRATINDFQDYQTVLKPLLTFVTSTYNSDLHLIAHSTGGSITVDYLLSNNQKDQFKSVILLAPFVRSALWHLSTIGHYLTKWWLNEAPRVFRKNTSDDTFREQLKKDPLQYRGCPTEWVKAHREWLRRIKSRGNSPKDILVIQGTKDSSIDWPYNLKFLKLHFPELQSHMISGAGHQLINESIAYRKQIYKEIVNKIENSQLTK